MIALIRTLQIFLTPQLHTQFLEAEPKTRNNKQLQVAVAAHNPGGLLRTTAQAAVATVQSRVAQLGRSLTPLAPLPSYATLPANTPHWKDAEQLDWTTTALLTIQFFNYY